MKKDLEQLLAGPIPLEPDNFTDHLWGGDWIPRMKGIPAQPGKSVGESWEFSGRPERPTQIRMPGGGLLSVRELISAAPNEVLGRSVVQRFGPEAPILVKFIDAKDDLSLQVHPADDYALEHAQDPGKSEAWMVLSVDKNPGDGFIYLGFNPYKASDYGSPMEFEEAFFNALNQANGQGPSTNVNIREKAARLVLPFLNRIAVKPGEAYAVRPGTVHALGKGVRLFEIQQSSDLTYRVWDWNRPDTKKVPEGKLEFRPLHLKEAREVLNFKATPADHYRVEPTVSLQEPGVFQIDLLVQDPEKKFAAERIRFDQPNAAIPIKTNGAFQVLTVIQGSVKIGVKVSAGRSVLIPASCAEAELRAVSAGSEVIRSYVPN